MGKINVERAMRQIAIKEGITVEDVRKEMIRAMLIGFYNPDPAIREKWRKIPHKGETPTPEEFIKYMARNVKDPL